MNGRRTLSAAQWCWALGLVCGPSSSAFAVDPPAASAFYAQRCATCHGATGAGDGLGAIGFSPKPRALRDPAWQASVTDAEISATILQGGAAVGKSVLMLANPDLASQPELLAALVRYVRTLKVDPPTSKSPEKR